MGFTLTWFMRGAQNKKTIVQAVHVHVLFALDKHCASHLVKRFHQPAAGMVQLVLQPLVLHRLRLSFLALLVLFVARFALVFELEFAAFGNREAFRLTHSVSD